MSTGPSDNNNMAGKGPWIVQTNQPCSTAGKNTTPAIVSINGGSGISGTFITDPNTGEQILCIPTYPYIIPPNTPITTTNPSGDPVDPPMTGTTTNDDPGTFPSIVLTVKAQSPQSTTD